MFDSDCSLRAPEFGAAPHEAQIATMNARTNQRRSEGVDPAWDTSSQVSISDPELNMPRREVLGGSAAAARTGQ